MGNGVTAFGSHQLCEHGVCMAAMGEAWGAALGGSLQAYHRAWARPGVPPVTRLPPGFPPKPPAKPPSKPPAMATAKPPAKPNHRGYGMPWQGLGRAGPGVPRWLIPPPGRGPGQAARAGGQGRGPGQGARTEGLGRGLGRAWGASWLPPGPLLSASSSLPEG